MERLDECTARFSVPNLIKYFGGWQQFADFLGVTLSSVGQYRRRDVLPVRKAVHLARHFGVSPDFFHDPWKDGGFDIGRAGYAQTEQYLNAALKAKASGSAASTQGTTGDEWDEDEITYR